MNQARENWLLFVDTNIFLDFYRMPGESAERQLKYLERHTDSLIICEQIWMEFLNNRQRVIVETMKNLNAPKQGDIPSVMADKQVSKMYRKRMGEAKEYHKEIKKKVEKLMLEPWTHDPVYQSVKRIFKANTPYNLKRPNKKRFAIRELARKRFLLGYPPRKRNDHSIGDAINWEWIVSCAVESTDFHHVLIVSRDSDYGQQLDKKQYLNDWLRYEFKKRVSNKRKIQLTNKLSHGLEKLNEHFSDDDIKIESEILNTWTYRKISDKDELFFPGKSYDDATISELLKLYRRLARDELNPDNSDE